MDAAGTSIYGNRIVFTNVRAKSATTTLNDYLWVTYSGKGKTLDLKAKKVDVFKNIGAYDDTNVFFAKNSALPASYRYGTQSLEFNQFNDCTVDGKKPFVMDLKAGTSLTICMRTGVNYANSGRAFTDVNYKSFPKSATLYGYDSAQMLPKFPFIDAPTGGIYLSRIPILRDGRYYFWIRPPGSEKPTMSLLIANENAELLPVAPITGTTQISSYLRADIRDYAKWKIKAAKNKIIIVQTTWGSNAKWHIIDKYGKVLITHTLSNNSSWMRLPVSISGTYYLIAEKEANERGIQLSGTITVQ